MFTKRAQPGTPHCSRFAVGNVLDFFPSCGNRCSLTSKQFNMKYENNSKPWGTCTVADTGYHVGDETTRKEVKTFSKMSEGYDFAFTMVVNEIIMFASIEKTHL